MSDIQDQYNSPQAPIVPERKLAAGSLTETMLLYLKEAAPWLKFIGIIGFISCGLIAFGSLTLIIVSIAASATLSGLINFPIWLMSPLYIGVGFLIFFPSLFMYRFGDKIRKYQFSSAEEDLEEAFKNNKSLWKFFGILCIVNLATVPIFLVISIVVGVAAANLF